jgi:two-component system CheB/CheR fusion protein
VVTDLAAEDHRIWADPSRLTQVLWNLLSNAVKFTPADGTITVRSRREDGLLLLQVSDTGIGIEPQVLPHVFGAFEQGRARSPRGGGGLGLGLAISKAIVELHGGRLTAESRGRGQGSTFTVSLPASLPKVDHDTGTIEVAGEPVAPPAPTAAPLHILLVEDHADTAEAMAELLSLLGYRVTTAGNLHRPLRLRDGRRRAPEPRSRLPQAPHQTGDPAGLGGGDSGGGGVGGLFSFPPLHCVERGSGGEVSKGRRARHSFSLVRGLYVR